MHFPASPLGKKFAYDFIPAPGDNGLRFWSDWGKQGCIEQADMDGRNRKMFVSTNICCPNSLTIDNSVNIYWTDARKKTIEACDLPGTTPREFLPLLGSH